MVCGLVTFRTLDRQCPSLSSTTPNTVSPSRYADFTNVNTATLSPSLLTSYETVSRQRASLSEATVPTLFWISGRDFHGLTTSRQCATFARLVRGRLQVKLNLSRQKTLRI
jgi:hypothetical protein